MRVFVGPPLLTLALAFALVGSASAGKADNPTITGIVGPGFSIRFVDDAGNRITQIPPGTYTVVIKDMASEHNFHLTGPGGFDMSTDVDAVGTFTWTVNFQVGTYHYQCDPHATAMKGDLTVDPSAPLPGSTPPAPTTHHDRAAAAPAASAARGQARGDRRPGRDDHGQARRQKARRDQGRARGHHGQRPLDQGQLPPDGPGREPRDLEGRPFDGQLAPDAEARDLPLPVGRDAESQGLVPRDLAPLRSSSAFSSAPKSSASAE